MKSKAPEAVLGWAALLVIAVGLLVMPVPEWIVERFYCRGAYPYIQAFVTGLSNLLPLAVLDLLLLGAFVAMVVRVIRMSRRGGLIAGVWEGLRRLIRVAAIVTILFVCFWGLNYRRVPLEQSLHVTPALPTVAQLQVAISDANALASRVRAMATSTNGPLSYEKVAQQLLPSFNAALAQLGRPALTTPGRPKFSLFLTPFFTWAGVTGMVDPLALESIVHPDLLPFERPFVLAHEWAHLAGQADEAEASAVGWLACMQTGPDLAYSASLFLIVEAGSALPPRAWQEARSHLDPAVQADLTALARRQEGERPVVRRTAFRAYDQYLRANRVEDGVTSYSRALSLILVSPFRDALASYRLNRDPAPR